MIVLERAGAGRSLHAAPGIITTPSFAQVFVSSTLMLVPTVESTCRLLGEQPNRAGSHYAQ